MVRMSNSFVKDCEKIAEIIKQQMKLKMSSVSIGKISWKIQ